MKKKRKGTSLDSFLQEEGIFDEVEAVAIKRVIAFQLNEAMEREQLNKNQMAAKMHTSRSALDRLLDPENTAVTLITLVKAAHVLGKKIKISFA